MMFMEWWQVAPGARVIGQVGRVAEITHDSRLVRPGWAFAAIPGAATDGHDHISAALASGAAAAVVQADREAKWKVFAGRLPLIVVPDTRSSLGLLAAAVKGDPSSRLRLIGVTGTDGKTTTTHLTAHVLSACGIQSGYLSSVGFETGSGFTLNSSHMTTLESTAIQASLAEAEQHGVGTMVIEASSEGLAQHRLTGCHFDVGVFTNLTRDHLDFHGSMERYLEAKGKLFEMLGESSIKTFPRASVLNLDDHSFEYLRARSQTPVLTYGHSDSAEFRVSSVRQAGLELEFDLTARGQALLARLPLIGAFNAYNAAAAVAVAVSQGAAANAAVAALSAFPGIPGRMERIECGQAFRVFVDIASTPSALENVLQALRPATRGRLWVVFGAAGGRDPARRAGMGAVAGRLADRCVLTSEDPRDEDPGAIITEIAEGLKTYERRAGVDYEQIIDRRAAIAHAFAYAGPEDTVLLAGKATETTMIVKGKALPWDERALARELLGDL
jgi:UDP-N-acetylmuramoyl-L-alanyl-D-glutamate--2,6-diaminopimelate ligase